MSGSLREVDAEADAVLGPQGRADGSSVQFDHLLHNGQPESEPSDLTGENLTDLVETFEEPRQILLRDSLSVAGEIDDHHILLRGEHDVHPPLGDIVEHRVGD